LKENNKISFAIIALITIIGGCSSQTVRNVESSTPIADSNFGAVVKKDLDQQKLPVNEQANTLSTSKELKGSHDNFINGKPVTNPALLPMILPMQQSAGQ
jgi:PBP1b-binding outer membrane lipoprotein LpoB